MTWPSKDRMLDRVISALVAVSLALLVWLYMRSRDQEVLDNVMVPVHITLAPGQQDQYDLEISGPSQVPLSFVGPPSRIHDLRALLQRGEFQIDYLLTVPGERLEEAHYLDTVRIDAGELHTPPGVTAIAQEGRNRIAVTLRRLLERQLPVRLHNAPEDRVAQVRFEPATVLVRGPQEVLDRARFIDTQPYNLPARGEAIGQEVLSLDALPLEQEIDGRRVRATPSTVTAHLTIQPQRKIYELADVPVQFLSPANFPLRPLFSDDRAGKISLRLVGPTGEELPAVVAFIELSGRKWEPGLYEEPVHLQLPKNFQLAQTPPRPVPFQLVPLEPAIKTAGGTQGQ
jgi:hypothetical protein